MSEVKVANVYQKLIVARGKFLEAGTSKSGKNVSLQFKYFELEDIVPAVTKIFNEVGLIAIVNYDEDIATMSIVNVDKPSETIEFQSPMRIGEPNRGTNVLQVLGAAHTYMRRYLYMMALDICEADEIDCEQQPVAKESQKPAEKESQKPVTKEERGAKKKAMTTGSTTEEQKTALKNALNKLLELDAKQYDFVMSLLNDTNNFEDCTKEAAEEIIKNIAEMIEGYGEQNG